MDRKKIVEDLKELFNQDVKTDKGRVALVNILLLFGIRFLVQISNIFFASMLGVYFRYHEVVEEELTAKELVRKIYPEAECKRKIGKGFWIYDRYDRITKRGIGSGKTPKQAWDSAFRRLRE